MEILVLHVPTRCSWVLTCGSRSMVATCWSRERPGSFLRARDFLAALLLPRSHLTERVPPKGHAPWSHGAFLWRRRPGRRRSFVACAGRGAVQRNGWRRRAPCGVDELGDAVEPLLVEVVDGAVAQELVRLDERGPCLHGSAVRVRRRTSRGHRRSSGAAVLPHRRMERGRLLLVPRRASGSVGGGRRRTTRWPAYGSRLSDAGGEGSPTLSSSTTSVRHGDDRATGHVTTKRKLQRTPT